MASRSFISTSEGVPRRSPLGRAGVRAFFRASGGVPGALWLSVIEAPAQRPSIALGYMLPAALTVIWLVGASCAVRHPRVTLALSASALLVALAPALATFQRSPTLTLAVVFAFVGLQAFVFLNTSGAAEEPIRATDVSSPAVRLGVMTGAWATFLLALGTVPSLPEIGLALAWSAGVVGLAILRLPWTGSVRHGCLRLITAGTLGSASAFMLLEPWGVAGSSVLPAVVVSLGMAHYLWASTPRVVGGDLVGSEFDWLGVVVAQPARLLALTFLAMSLVFFFLLRMPIATAAQEPLAWMDALFLAVSAVCVTGLTTVDTATALSVWGHVVLLLGFQAGAFGMLTFSAAILFALGRRVSLGVEGAVARIVHASSRATIVQTLRTVILYALAVETISAVIFFAVFVAQGEGPVRAAGRAAFLAVSSFCNTGLTTESAGLRLYSEEPFVLAVVSANIILGGLSPFVALRAPQWLARSLQRAWLWCRVQMWRRGRRWAASSSRAQSGERALRLNPPQKLPIQDQLSLYSTAVLLFGGMLVWILVEWERSLAGLEWTHKLANAWFQSVTTRSAGFSSVPVEEAHSATLIFSAVLMFIGGSPGGVAGGIKTTTAALLVLAVLATMQGRQRIRIGYRLVSHASVYRAAATVFVMGGLVGGFTMLLSLTQEIGLRSAAFEVVSALCTVGLSIGATAHLDEVGKAIIVACMFIGRLGPLALFFIIASRAQEPQWHLAEEDIEVG